MLYLVSSRGDLQSPVEGEPVGPVDYDEEGEQKHRRVEPDGGGELPEPPGQLRKLGGGDRHRHNDRDRDRCQPGEEAEQDQKAAD